MVFELELVIYTKANILIIVRYNKSTKIRQFDKLALKLMLGAV